MAGAVVPDGILVPKISTVEDLGKIGARLSEVGASASVKVWAMIETARAVLDADKLAAASRDPKTRLAGFVFGPNDIARETRIRMLPGRLAMIPMITHCVLAAHAHGLEMLDGPYGDIGNLDGFAAECAQGRDLGFDGKTLIHPSHIDACNAIFTPPAEEVAEARKIIAAFELPENASRGAIQLDGPHGRAAARRDGQAHHRHRGCDREDGKLGRPRLLELLDRGLVRAIVREMLRRCARGEITVASRLVAAERADPLHVAQHQRMGALQPRMVDVERVQQQRQFVGSRVRHGGQARPGRPKKSPDPPRCDRIRRDRAGVFH